VLGATRKDDAGPPQPTLRGAGPVPLASVVLVTLIYLLRSAGEGVVGTFFNVYLDADLRVPTSLIGTVMALGQILSALAALGAPLVMARWGKGRAVVLGFAGITLSLLPLVLIRHWVVAGVAFVGFVGMISIMNAPFFIFSQEAVSPPWRPFLSGATMMAQGLSGFALSLGGGYAIAALGYRSPFTMAMVLTAIGTLLFWAFCLRASREGAARAPACDGAE
jgi:predicted MFS family arabinose efflux permease